MGIEPDLIDRREKRIEEGRPEIDESVGGEKSGCDGRFPRQPMILAKRVKSKQWQHSPGYPSSCSVHLRSAETNRYHR